MEEIVTWATILSPIIAVIIAAWMVWVNTKSTQKEIAALKELSILQIDTTLLELESEYFKAATSMKDYRDEIERLRIELHDLNINPKTTELDRMEFIRKIEKLSENSSWQNAWCMKIFHAQAQLTFAQNRIANYKRK